jgi:hypothetical protein
MDQRSDRFDASQESEGSLRTPADDAAGVSPGGTGRSQEPALEVNAARGTKVKFEGETLEGADDSPTGLERRRGPGRRRTDYSRQAEEGEMTPEQFLFVKSVDAFKQANGKMYPSWTDVLEVVRLLGYRKTRTSEIVVRGADDWTEAPDAPSGVRSKPGHPEKRGGTSQQQAA